MNDKILRETLDQLIAHWEGETAEFKQADRNYDTDKIGQYFSALSNEANLRGAERAWLVFGVNNRSRQIVGSDYRPEPDRLQGLKMQIADSTEPSVTFRNIHELKAPEGRVILLEIPAAPRGMPIAWKGHYYARAGESLTSLGLDKLDDIRQQTLMQDWSAQSVAAASLSDLDPLALRQARDSFARKYANRFAVDEVAGWSDRVFLDRARITQNGAITRTALLLLGKPESAHLLSPHPAQMTWKLEGAERAYEHFGPPFLLNTTRLYQRIRNIQVRLLPQDQLLPIEVSKYDQKIVLEALHNCIAHQDYTRHGRIIVTETLDRLIFENEGGFYEGTPDDYIEGAKTPRRYRNPFLAQAMSELNMIDTMGYGIHEMHMGQARRYFPLPDYDVSDGNGVKMTIYGGVVDPAYTKLLMQKTDLPMLDVLALDRVQKKLSIPDDAATRLRRGKLIEGRKPHFHVSAVVAAATGDKAEYIRMRSFDDTHFTSLIVDYIKKFGSATRKDIDKLLVDKLSEALNDEQKRRKIGNLISGLRMKGVIRNSGPRTAPLWSLSGTEGERSKKDIKKAKKES